MDQDLTIDITNLPPTGGLTGDPTVLPSLDDFLSEESHLQKVRELLEKDGCFVKYLSLVDCLLVELLSDYEVPCREFYERDGKLLVDLDPPVDIEDIDEKLVAALEDLFSKQWPTLKDFKSNYKIK